MRYKIKLFQLYIPICASRHDRIFGLDTSMAMEGATCVGGGLTETSVVKKGGQTNMMIKNCHEAE